MSLEGGEILRMPPQAGLLRMRLLEVWFNAQTLEKWCASGKLLPLAKKKRSIEEFIQRVEEWQAIAHLADEDLLNAMTELFSGVALHRCRQERKNLHTWDDFCAAVRSCYDVDRRL